MCISEKIVLSTPGHREGKNGNLERWPPSRRKAFSLIETVAALAILGLVSLSVLVVVDRCVGSMVDSELRMQAFEVARENMEKLLVQPTAKEMVEYGSSEKNPDILWQTIVEAFHEPLTSRMWIRATCSAEYFDMAGEAQTVELTHWLTSVTKKQLIQMAEQRKKVLQRLAEADQLIGTTEEAAEYAETDVESIEQWAKSGGMPVTEDGRYVKLYLDLYTEHDGEPPVEARLEADEAYAELTGRNVAGGVVPTGPTTRRVPGMPGATPRATPGATPTPGGSEPGTGQAGPREEVIPGYTADELYDMPPEKLWPLVSEWLGQ
jgi:prepilin-type N-terminal cleavage/methylation domain-containing protein